MNAFFRSNWFVIYSTNYIVLPLSRPEKQLLERRESLEEVEERRRQLAARLALGLEPGKRKPEEIPIPPAEAYIVTPHRKRRPGFHNAPAQNPAFVPFNPGFETPRRLQAPHPLSVSAPPYLVHKHFSFIPRCTKLVHIIKTTVNLFILFIINSASL